MPFSIKKYTLTYLFVQFKQPFKTVLSYYEEATRIIVSKNHKEILMSKSILEFHLIE